MKMKKVSVVVPCYNAAQYLDKCIEHLLHQTIGIENMEIILVNDASTDEGATWNLITEYEKKFPDTIMAITLEQNMRQGGARNVGVSYAGGEYLIFCDADDWLLEEALLHCYQTAKEYDADVVEFLIHNVKNHDISVELITGNDSRLIELDTEGKKKNFLVHTSRQCSLGSQKKFYRLSMIQDNHITFAEHLIFEEPSFVLPTRFYERRHYFLDEQLYICYLSPGSTVRSDWGEHKWDNPKVWMHLMNDLEERGLLQEYYPEIEYLFCRHGLGLSISMTLQQGYFLMKEEVIFLVNMVLELFPQVRENKYIKANGEIWNALILKLLDLEITDESIVVINEIYRKYV